MLTASEFLAAFKHYTELSLAEDAYELRDLERAILRYLPAAARMAQQLADGRLSGGPFSAVFVPLERNVGRVLEEAAPLERRLWHARAAAGLAPRPFDAEANGTSATMALLGIARCVVNVVWEAVGGWACAFDDDDEAPGIYEVMEWESTAGELRERFGADFRFPDPAPLLHEMRMELMQLDALVAPDAPTVTTTVRLCEAVPMREAAKNTKRPKKPKPEPEIEPLPPERPHPVEVKQPAANPIPVYIVAPPDGERSPLTPAASGAATPRTPIIYSLGDSAYRVGDGKPVSVKENEDAVLQAFVGMPVMNSSVLKSRSSNNDAPLVLNRLRKRYEEAFASAIQCPGTPGKGGYTARVEIATQHIP